MTLSLLQGVLIFFVLERTHRFSFRSTKEEDIGFGRMNQVVFPTRTHLDPKHSPFFLFQKTTKGEFGAIFRRRDDMPRMKDIRVLDMKRIKDNYLYS